MKCSFPDLTLIANNEKIARNFFEGVLTLQIETRRSNIFFRSLKKFKRGTNLTFLPDAQFQLMYFRQFYYRGVAQVT